MEKKLRKYQSMLICWGWGVVLLCAWDVIDLILQFYAIPEAVRASYSGEAVPESYITISIVISVVLACLLIFLRLLVSRASILFAEEKKNKKGFILLSIILLAIQIFSAYQSFISITDPNVVANYSQFAFEIFSVLVIIALIITSLLVISTKNKIKKGAEEKGV